jgi:CheY-like chemotaxis protein
VNILLVDDDAEIRLIATHMLRGADHKVREAPDAATATACMAAAVPDVLLMDVMLGEEDGVAVARELLAVARQSGQPPPRLIFLTGASRADQLERLNAERPAGVIQKPFDPATLADTVVRIIQGGV